MAYLSGLVNFAPPRKRQIYNSSIIWKNNLSILETFYCIDLGYFE